LWVVGVEGDESTSNTHTHHANLSWTSLRPGAECHWDCNWNWVMA